MGGAVAAGLDGMPRDLIQGCLVQTDLKSVQVLQSLAAGFCHKFHLEPTYSWLNHRPS